MAFFDVDNTLMRGASMYHLAWGAYTRGYLRPRDIMRFSWQQARFIAVGENRKHLEVVRERALGIVAGHSASEFRELAESIFDRAIERRLWPESVSLAREHLAKGHQVWLVSATPIDIAQVIAKRLGLTGALGTVLEIEDGRFTGRLIGPALHGPTKAVAAKKLATSIGADLSECWAYSDSENDIPLLELAGHRIVVNPDASLLRHAKQNEWEILRLNKKSLRAARKRVRREGKIAN